MRAADTSGRRGTDSERFAEVVDLGERAVRSADPELRRQLEVVALLRRCAPELGPDEPASRRIRARLMADLGALGTAPVAHAPVAHAEPAHPVTGRHRRAAPAGPRTPRRLIVAAAAALCLVLGLTAAIVQLSRDALPGDALYGVKRAAESAELGLTFAQEAKAHKHLEFAAARLDEVEGLAGRGPDAVSVGAHVDVTLITRTLQAFDDEAAAGTRLLLPLATEGSGADLDVVSTWAQQQAQRLAAVRSWLPTAAQQQADSSLNLLSRVATRAAALSDRISCDRVTAGAADDIGPLPATGGCLARQGPDGAAAPPTLTSGGAIPTQLPGEQAQQAQPSHPGQPSQNAGKPNLPSLNDPRGGGPLIDPKLGQPGQPGTPSPRVTVPLPMPGLPRVNLLPLLPGMPGITVT